MLLQQRKPCWGGVARNVIKSEAIAAAQQATLMATGLQSKPDGLGFVTAAFNGLAGIAIQAKFGSELMCAGLAAGVTMAGDTFIRGERVDTTQLSARWS